MKKYKVGLVIGRFQPFHKGHLSLIKQSLSFTRNIIICIGSSNVFDFDNPYSAKEREEMLKNELAKENLLPHILKIIYIPDDPSDTAWLASIIQKTGAFDIVIGNNDYVNNIFSHAGFKTIHVSFYKRYIYEGQKIREKLRSKNKLAAKDRLVIKKPVSKQPIPANAKKVYTGKIFDIYQWEQQLFDGSMTTFEKVKSKDTVIIIPVTTDGKIIICRQEQPRTEPFTGVFGGRIEENETPLLAAKRELLEETGYQAKEFILWDALQLFTHIEWNMYIYIAKQCKKVSDQKLDKGEKIDLLFVTFDEFIAFVNKSQFRSLEISMKILKAQLDLQEMKKLRKLFS